MGTALHLAQLQPRDLVRLTPALRKIVVRFQSRAQQLGLTMDVLPQMVRRAERAYLQAGCEQLRRGSPLVHASAAQQHPARSAQ